MSDPVSTVRHRPSRRPGPTPESRDAHPVDHSTPSRERQLKAIALFLVIAFGLCWLACAPLWMGPGLSDPALVALCGGIAMFTPALAAIVTVRITERRSWRRSGGAPGRDTVLASLGMRIRIRRGRFIGALAIGIVAPVLWLLVAQIFAGAAGSYDLDLTLRSTAANLGLPTDVAPAGVWLAFGGRLLMAMALGATITSILTVGEELGWRGYLMPRLERLWGRTAAILVGGVIWGLWHAPLILLGYNYPDAAPFVGLLAMIAACTAMGGMLYWLTVRFESIWPATLAHGVNNAASGMIVAGLIAPGATVNTITGSVMGWPGWVVYGTLVIVGFLLIRRWPLPFPKER